MEIALGTLAGVCALPLVAAGPPWVDAPSRLLTSGTRSVEILARDEPLYARPAEGAKARGAAAEHAFLPWYAETTGAGCTTHWIMVGSEAWVCGSRVRPSAHAALSPRPDHPMAEGESLPFRYFFVGPTGSAGYSSLADAGRVEPNAEYEPGFALAVGRLEERAPGDAWALTSKGLWVEARDLVPAGPVPALGRALQGSLDVGWVYRDSAPVYRSPAGGRASGQILAQFTQFGVKERRSAHGQSWYRIGEGEWVTGRDVRVPTVADPPADVVPGERWVDVELTEQVLTAYQGRTAVFATLVSTGRGTQGSELATPRGEHRIWVKLRSGDMDNLEDEEARRYYAIQEVPWVMYFARGYGLHGTFWHRSFGRPRSHGCVNLTPSDAAWLFFWSAPRVPAGWTAALPSQYDPGTRVRVR